MQIIDLVGKHLDEHRRDRVGDRRIASLNRDVRLVDDPIDFVPDRDGRRASFLPAHTVYDGVKQATMSEASP
jgi:hypothetical protein